jgi:putative peptide zinc metalloprotease protein
MNAESRLVLRNLSVRDDGDEYVVGDPATGTFVALPEIGLRAIRLLQDGHAVGEVAALLPPDESEVDVEEFVEQLVELGFVEAIDGEVLDDELEPQQSTRLRWLSIERAQLLFNRKTCVAYVVLLAAALATVVRNPGLVPSYHDFFWSPHPGLVLAVNTLAFLVSASAHELAHLAAARSLGVEGRWTGLSLRRHHLVFQTDLTALWTLPRERRYRAYLAGLMWDTALLATLVLAEQYAPAPDSVTRLLRALTLVIGLAIVPQFFLHTKSDLYYVVRDFVRCDDLLSKASGALQQRLRAPLRRTRSAPDSREARAIAVYSWLILLGVAIWLASLAFYGLPILFTLLWRAALEVERALESWNPLALFDGAAAFAIQAFFTGLSVFMLVRRRLAAHR